MRFQSRFYTNLLTLIEIKQFISILHSQNLLYYKLIKGHITTQSFNIIDKVPSIIRNLICKRSKFNLNYTNNLINLIKITIKDNSIITHI